MKFSKFAPKQDGMTYRALEKMVIGSLTGIYGYHEAKSIQRVLFEDLLEISAASFLLIRDEETGLQFEELVIESLAKLKQFTPVQYVTGFSTFCGFRFKVKPGVLIPRPETEELVGAIVSHCKAEDKIRILDIGTGSGAIAISLRLLIPLSEVHATDISQEALEVASFNASALEADVQFFLNDILRREDWRLMGTYDLIVSNPPYIRQQEKALMSPNVLDYEPAVALFVPDDDPLLFYRGICEFATEKLIPGGTLWFEINESEGEAMLSLLTSFGFSNITIMHDFRGKQRFISARKIIDYQ